MHVPAAVPIEPFRKILENELEKIRRIDDRAGWEVFEKPLGMKHRFIWQIVTPGRQAILSFPVADRIVTAILGPEAWYNDPELKAIYEGADLKRLDWYKPLTDEIRADQDQLILDQYGVHGNCRDVANELGCSLLRVNEVTKEYRAQLKAAA